MSDKKASIKLKITKAKMLLSEVDVLMQYQFYATAINRLYYSCYHATKALLLTKDIVTKTHNGVVSQLHQHFVENNIFDFDQASFFSRLMQERIEDDYGDFIILNENDAKGFVEPAKGYVTICRKPRYGLS